MIKIDILLLLKIFTLLLGLILASLFIFDQVKYRKLYRMYEKELIASRRLESLSRWNPLIPKQRSRRYQEVRKLLSSAGVYINVEYFYTVKLLACLIGTLFFAGIYLSNVEMSKNDIIINPNYGKTALDKYTDASHLAQVNEKRLYLNIESQLNFKTVKGIDLSDANNRDMLIEYISNLIAKSGLRGKEEARVIAVRMYQKLIKIRHERQNISGVLGILLLALFLYNIPDVILRLKIKLIEDKKDWEVLNCTYVYSIFGRLPPYNIRTILSNMLVVVDIFRPLISELNESLKNGKGEKAFTDMLEKVENQDLSEMLETMKLSIKTGMLNTLELVDDAAENQLKWLEIKGIKRRKAKQLFAMIPVVVVMLLAAVYFSYSLSVLSNPTNFIR